MICRLRTHYCRLILRLALFLLFSLLPACQQQAETSSVDPLSAYPWLYLRDGQPPGSQEKLVSLIAVGDILLGRGVSAPDHLHGGPEQALEAVAPWLSQADLALGNLEGVFAMPGLAVPPASTPSAGKLTPTNLEASTLPIQLNMSPEAANWLQQAGVDVLGLANNHALDAGQDGLAETVRILQEAGLSTVGAGTGQKLALQPVLHKIRGLRIAILGVNAIPIRAATETDPASWDIARWDEQAVRTAVQQARFNADIVIVSIHWGYEYQWRVDPAQEKIAEVLFQAGADVVIGHHPHVVQDTVLVGPEEEGVIPTRARLAAYSLGNFVFDQGEGETGRGLALRLFFDAQGLRAAQALPIAAGPRPRLLPPEQAAGVGFGSESPVPPSQNPLPRHPLFFTCKEQGCEQVETDLAEITPDSVEKDPGSNPAVSPQAAIFTSGSADLTGDGEAEEIHLQDGRISIYQAQAETWLSPAEWQVVDLALGDPDWDGRPDLLAAFWKPDPSGVLRSHPFLIRQQAGRFQEVWGGSAVSEPILEVEIGDLDGDGLDELIVLEQHPDGYQTVGVWRWHGWGFRLDWRSQPAYYQDLELLGNIGQKIIQVWQANPD